MPIKCTVLQMSRFRQWLFLYGTRIIELMNAVMIVGFSLVFITDLFDGVRDMGALDSFADFAKASDWYWMVFLALGVAQLISMSMQSIRSNKASAFTLILSSAIWAFIAGTFISSRDGLITTAPVIYGIIAIVTFLAGYELLSVNKQIESAIKKGA